MFPTLEKYHGTRTRHTCPACNTRNCFVHYIDERGEYLSTDVGRCNRESKCGYHYKPKQYFADNPQIQSGYKKGKGKNIDRHTYVNKNGLRVDYEARIVQKKPDFISFEQLKLTLGNYDRNAFLQFLLNLFPDCSEEIQAVLKMYFVGTWKDGLTVFWQIDRRGKIRTGKIMRYDAQNGHRQIVRTWTDKDGEKHELKVDWMHGKIKKDFNLMQCFFGEHLLCFDLQKPVAIVEAEKTAVLASICFPEFVWLAIGSKQCLKPERLKRLGTRKIVLYPDADGFELWQSIALDAQRQGSTIKVSNLIESHATDEQKATGYDLADYLINEQAEINQHNNYVDSYNAKLDCVLSDENLFQDFETILDEQTAVAVVGGELSEAEAERICTQPENLRSVVLSV